MEKMDVGSISDILFCKRSQLLLIPLFNKIKTRSWTHTLAHTKNNILIVRKSYFHNYVLTIPQATSFDHYLLIYNTKTVYIFPFSNVLSRWQFKLSENGLLCLENCDHVSMSLNLICFAHNVFCLNFQLLWCLCFAAISLQRKWWRTYVRFL